jgi:hypothetical protein
MLYKCFVESYYINKNESSFVLISQERINFSNRSEENWGYVKNKLLQILSSSIFVYHL